MLNHPAVTVASYLVFQGMRYMTSGERTFKIALTIFFTTLLVLAGLHPLIALLFGHGLNFMSNGQIPVLMRYVVSDVGLTGVKVKMALDKFSGTAQKFGVTEILVFGSFSRHSMKSSSDLDLRFYHRPDFFSAFVVYLYATYIRIWANVNFIPIDVYCFSNPAFLNRMRADENPALLFCSDDMLLKYPKAQDPYAALSQNEALS